MSRVKVDIENGQRLYNEALKALPGEAALQFADTLALQRLPAACPVNLETIAWYPGLVRNEEVLEALLSDEDAERFRLGEAQRCNKDKFITSKKEKDGSYCMYKCPCCRAGFQKVLGARKEGVRGVAEKGSKKVGCPVRFSLARVQPGVMRVRYVCYDHLAECLVQSPRRLSVAVRARALAACVKTPDLQPSAYVRENADYVAREYAEQRKMTVDDAKALFHRVRSQRAAVRARCDANSETLSFPPLPQEPNAAPPDYWLSEEDVHNIKAEWNSHKWKLDPNPTLSLQMWRHEHTDEVIYFQAQQTELRGGERVETVPFIFILVPRKTLDLARKCLRARPVLLCDATFGTPHAAALPRAYTLGLTCMRAPRGGAAGLNAQRFPVTTLMAVDEHAHGLPVVHAVHSASNADVFVTIFNAVRDCLGHDIKVKYVVTDDCPSELAGVAACQWGIKDGCKSALCAWHVKRAWLVNLLKLVKGPENKDLRNHIFRTLNVIQGLTARPTDARIHTRSRFCPQDKDAVAPRLEKFKQTFAKSAPEFYAYFDKQWVAAQKFRLWIAAYRDLTLCPTTTSAIEAYHGTIKLLFTNTRCAGLYKRRRGVIQAGLYKPNAALQAADG